MDLSVMKRHFTIHDYRQMYAAGILSENDRVELLDGEIYHMSPLGPWHVEGAKSATLRLRPHPAKTLTLGQTLVCPGPKSRGAGEG